MENKNINEIKKLVLEKAKLPKLIIYEWGEGIPNYCNISVNLNKFECWYIKYNFKCGNQKLESARILILDKKSNEVLFDGPCNNEG
ncbi:hypothetical protein FHQ18_09540 [Deferribacter autotrophicus]|uniref:Uncharacterized protein n=1 Tax=Deferribacter autotrophicus TaxID=500465 RepID=A0A5A8F4P6_9BACT|nr:hypothetical protein [Deferribacter autotrophicus]KAA0257573.1 hypothetical protein FHQ18_09540 [Deferribacter autotrophicus]